MGIEILIAASAVILTSLVGVVFVHHIARAFLEKRLSYLVSFSAGVFLVTAGVIALEAFNTIPVWGGIVGMVLGYGVAWGMHALMPETHHHHDSSCTRSHDSASKLLMGGALHNVVDGIILVPAFLVSPALGVATTVSIIIHETLKKTSNFFVLRHSGYSTAKALALNFGVSSTILLGVALSYFALATGEIEGALLAISAGFFLHVVLHDLLPRRHDHHEDSHYIRHVALTLLGIATMAGIGLFLGGHE